MRRIGLACFDDKNYFRVKIQQARTDGRSVWSSNIRALKALAGAPSIIIRTVGAVVRDRDQVFG